MIPDYLIPVALVVALAMVFVAIVKILGLDKPKYAGTNVAFDLSETQSERLKQQAERLGVKPADLARAAVVDLLAKPDEDFRAALERVLQKNAELYKRLA